MANMNRGAAVTREYLQESGQKQADLARLCGVSDVTVLNWLRGNIRPNEPRRRTIARWSGGRVPVEAWDEEQPADADAGASPFAGRPPEAA